MNELASFFTLKKFQSILAAEQMMNVRYRHVHRDVGHVDGTTDLPPLEVVNLAVDCPLFFIPFWVQLMFYDISGDSGPQEEEDGQ